MGATPVMAGIPPALQAIPSLGGAGGWVTGGLMAGARAALPVLNTVAALASGYVAIKGIWYTPQGQAVGRRRRRRRVNPLNYRAAMRAARRLGAVQDLLGRINKALPMQRTIKKVRVGRRRRK
jgi:hypothetical protein